MKVCTTCGSEWANDTKFCPNDGSVLRSQRDTRDLIGAVLGERYHIIQELGAGGMGAVYLGEHVRMGLKVAIKVMAPALANDPDAIVRFNREAKNAARIKHPNVCAVYDYGETPDGVVYLAMEYVEGEALTELLDREGFLSAPRAASIVMQCADAVQAAHDLGIVHRDLKPDNIMITKARDGTDAVTVVDFGIAKAMVAEEGQTVTKSGFIVGTPEYMSPEQVSGARLDARSDIYSLALVLFRMLTGSLPFRTDTPEEAFAARLTADPLKLSQALPGAEFSAELQAVLDRALARNPSDRYDSAIDFGKDVVAALGGLPPLAAQPDTQAGTQPIGLAQAVTPETPQPRPQPTRAVRRKAPVAAVVGGLAVLAVGGAAVTLAVRHQSERAATESESLSVTGPSETADTALLPSESEQPERLVLSSERTARARALSEIEALIAEGRTGTALERLDRMRERDITDEGINQLIGQAVKTEVDALAPVGDYDGAIAKLTGYLEARPYLERMEADLKGLYLEKLRYEIEKADQGGSSAYRRLVEEFPYDAEVRYQASLLMAAAEDLPVGWFVRILEIDSSYRDREPILAYARAALDTEEWWHNQAAHELIGKYYYDELRTELLTSLESEDDNRRLNAFEILRQYGEEDLAQRDLYQYHRLNLAHILRLWDIGNLHAHVDRAVEYSLGLGDEARLQWAIDTLEAIRSGNPDASQYALRYVEEVIDRLRRKSPSDPKPGARRPPALARTSPSVSTG